MSLEKAQAIFETEITKHENDLKKVIKVDLTQGQYDALVDMVYNMGIGNFKETDTFTFVNNNQLSRVPKRLRSVRGDEVSCNHMCTEGDVRP
jgi:lysozyme